MRSIVVLAAALWILSPVPGSAGDHAGRRPVSGAVEEVDAAARTLMLGGDEFFVPADTFDVSKLKAGDHVVVRWELRGTRMVAVHIDHGTAGN